MPAAPATSPLEADADSAADAAVSATLAATEPSAGIAMRPSAAAVPARMDRAFIASHHIVERYIAGRLPRKGAQDFEQFCRAHPELLEEIGLGERLQAALRLLEAGGQAPPWEEKSPQWWQQLPVIIGAGALCAVLAIAASISGGRLASQERAVAALQTQLAAQPLNPAESTRSIALIPSRTAPSQQSLATIGGGATEFAELHINMGWSKFGSFQVLIDRIDQGRVAVLRGLLRDSNGDLRIGLNSSALGPGDYQFTIEGLNWRGESQAQAWATITIAPKGK
jgi:hypothetical protein